MIVIPDYLIGRWHKNREWHYCHENRNLFVYDDEGAEYIITHRGHFANKIIAKRHNENLLLGISDAEYNETAKAAVIPKLDVLSKKTNGFKRMGGQRPRPLHQRDQRSSPVRNRESEIPF